MIKGATNEKELWSQVTDMLGDRRKTFGRHWSHNLRNDPKRLAFVLARYKFSAKMLPAGSRVLELGCSEGIGCPILAEQATSYTGIDCDPDAIDAAGANLPPATTASSFSTISWEKTSAILTPSYRSMSSNTFISNTKNCSSRP